MALKNKDGSPFTLQGPNPLMKGQNIFKERKIVNLVPQRIIITDKTQIDETVDKKETFFDGMKPDNYLHEDRKTVQCWCLPAIYKEFIDPLYNESHKKMRWGKKYVFNLVLVEMTDLSLVVKTEEKMAEGSILYPQTNDKRWWRVEKTKDNLLYCGLSAYQPVFEDKNSL